MDTLSARRSRGRTSRLCRKAPTSGTQASTTRRPPAARWRPALAKHATWACWSGRAKIVLNARTTRAKRAAGVGGGEVPQHHRDAVAAWPGLASSLATISGRRFDAVDLDAALEQRTGQAPGARSRARAPVRRRPAGRGTPPPPPSPRGPGRGRRTRRRCRTRRTRSGRSRSPPEPTSAPAHGSGPERGPASDSAERWRRPSGAVGDPPPPAGVGRRLLSEAVGGTSPGAAAGSTWPPRPVPGAGGAAPTAGSPRPCSSPNGGWRRRRAGGASSAGAGGACSR